MRAARELQTVRRDDKQTIGRHTDVHTVKEQIAHGNKRALKFPAFYTEYCTKAHSGGKEQVDQLIRLPLHPRQIRQSRNREHHIEDAEKGEQDEECEHTSNDPRQERLNALKPRHADVPDPKEEHRRKPCHKEQHTDEESLFRT